jgi:hypothetical protein
MIVLVNVCSIFESELTEIFNRYQQGKKPAYYNYKFRATSQQQLLEFGIAQMLSNKPFITTLFEKDRNNLSFEQWLIYEWFSKSLKGNDHIILNKVKTFNK